MGYQVSGSEYDSQRIQERIQKTDLVPSLECIRKETGYILTKLKLKGIDNLEKCTQALNNKKKIKELSIDLSIDENILVLFRREIEGWKIKIRSIDELNWIDSEIIKRIVAYGIKNAEDAFNLLNKEKERKRISKDISIDEHILKEIFSVSELMRIRWLSPNISRLLYELKYTVVKIQKANSELLCNEIFEYNKVKKYYNGKIGERDIKRIIFESQYVNI